MDQQAPIEDKKSFLHNDPLLVCGMLTFYGVCILALIGATIWGLDRRSKKISANATSTANAIATEQARSTATTIARTTEQAGYGFVDRFDEASWRWECGAQDSEYWRGSKDILDGVYVWDVVEAKKNFIAQEDLYEQQNIVSFDVYVDTKILQGKRGEVCSGLIFRKSRDGWDKGAYVFSVCNDSHFEVDYHGPNGWEDITDWKYTDVIRNSDWNRIQVSARDEHFILSINNVDVLEMEDDRQTIGGLAILIAVREKNPAVVWFDNFGYQTR